MESAMFQHFLVWWWGFYLRKALMSLLFILGICCRIFICTFGCLYYMSCWHLYYFFGELQTGNCGISLDRVSLFSLWNSENTQWSWCSEGYLCSWWYPWIDPLCIGGSFISSLVEAMAHIIAFIMSSLKESFFNYKLVGIFHRRFEFIISSISMKAMVSFNNLWWFVPSVSSIMPGLGKVPETSIEGGPWNLGGSRPMPRFLGGGVQTMSMIFREGTDHVHDF